MLENFLSNIWKAGALQGATPNDAFSVQIGLGITMTEQDILNGFLLHCRRKKRYSFSFPLTPSRTYANTSDLNTYHFFNRLNPFKRPSRSSRSTVFTLTLSSSAADSSVNSSSWI